MPGIESRDVPSLGAELRLVRHRSGRTVRDVADALGWSSSKLSRVETSMSRIGSGDLDLLLDLYGLDQDERARVEALAQRFQRFPSGSYALPDTYEKFVHLEDEASQICTYGAIVIPGLLQTVDYAAAVINATPIPESQFAKERVITRMARQALLARDPPLTLRVVIDEAVLRRPVGGANVMHRQMLRLIEASQRPDTTIQVLPFDVGAHPAVTGQFAILDFADDAPPWVFCDGLTGGVLRGKMEDVFRYRACYDALAALALDTQESIDIFAATAKANAALEREMRN